MHAAEVSRRAPARSDPETLTPHPPARDLRIEELRIGAQLLNARASRRHQPAMARVKIGFVDGIVGIVRDLLGISGEGAPEVREVALDVVYRLNLRWCRTSEQHGERPCERFDVVADGAEALPDQRRDARLPAEPGERGFERSAHATLRKVSAHTQGFLSHASFPLIFAK